MAAVAAISKVLLVDADSWRVRKEIGGLRSPAVITIGASAVLAFARFGPQAFVDPRGAVRFILVGFYGWVALSGAIWWLGRRAGSETAFTPVMGVIGRAHMPLLIVAVAIQMASVTLDLLGPARWVAVFAAVVWMPVMLVTASNTAFGFVGARSLRVISGPYLVWLVTIGGFEYRQLAHLL